jgi:DNA-binding transcriptional regulator YbjK
VPPVNEERRAALADAAVAVAARLGTHGLTHRAVDDEAGMPRGTTSNYFRSRETLLAAALTRAVELHFQWVTGMRARHPEPLDRTATIALLSDVVSQAVTRHRGRYIAMFELFLESTRRPELAEALAGIEMTAMAETRRVHAITTPASDLDLVLVTVFYNGALFTSLVMPGVLGQRDPGEITRVLLDRVLPRDSDAGPGGAD